MPAKLGTRIAVVGAACVALLAASCGASGGEGPVAGGIRLYTSATADTVDAVVAAFGAANPGAGVELFRAPTGEVNARIAAERREGGLRADVLWMTDPLSMQQYAAEDLLAAWEPVGAAAVPEEYAGGAFYGTRVLNLVIVAAADADPRPATWTDLADPSFGPVAIPDPGFAGSAFAALGYFALDQGYGMGFYRALADAGAVQVRSPGDVVNGVAEGQYRAGITLDKTARTAVEKGSPIELIWPEGGAIALYSPIGVVAGTENRAAAEAFADFVLTREAQEAIAATGWEPVRSDVDWPDYGPVVTVDWQAAFDRQEELLNDYRQIFGG